MKHIFFILASFVMISCVTNKPHNNIEDEYLSEKKEIFHRDNFIIITGCSGGGKSTILSGLSRKGYLVVPEPGRQIVKEQESIGGYGLPWKNLDHFLELALSRYIFQYNSQKEKQKYVFFDRGILDSVQLKSSQARHFEKAAEKYRYNLKVFMLPPWLEIYKSDSERKHSFEDAVKEYEELLIKYKKFGYEVILVPKMEVKKRVDFILKNL
jgi:predicted ATPase